MKISYYMRILTSIIFVITITFCAPLRSTQDQAHHYTVSRLDSIGNFYLIYAMRNDSIFQIASGKTRSTNCDPLEVNGKYVFKLKSRIFIGEVNGTKITRATNDLVKCIGLDRVTTVCFDDNCVQDLFYTENIAGLCYRP
jgi:hypothetical protein